MRGTPITGSARGVSITDTVSRAQEILRDRPEPRGRDRYANRTNRTPRGGGDGAARSADDAAPQETPETSEQTSEDDRAATSPRLEE
jgi:hypothetical protein